MIRMLTELDGKMPEIKSTITRVMRLKDQSSGKEDLVYNKHLEFNDKNGNLRTLDYTNYNSHEEAEGIVRRNIHHEITESEVKGVKIVFDELWNKNKFEQLGSNEGTELIIGYTKTKGKNSSVYSIDKSYSIKNAEDFKTGKFEDLIQLAQRGLSSTEPSLKKLAQPVSEDPITSLYKKERGYISPSAISYNQRSYQ